MTSDGASNGRDERADRALQDALDERARLWEELQRKNALEADLAYWRGRASDIERSRWWRAGKPLRLAKRFAADPAQALEDAASIVRRRQRG